MVGGFLQIDRSGTWVDIGPSLSKSDLAPTAFHETTNMKLFREEIALPLQAGLVLI
jgi:hypothetical protein